MSAEFRREVEGHRKVVTLGVLVGVFALGMLVHAIGSERFMNRENDTGMEIDPPITLDRCPQTVAEMTFLAGGYPTSWVRLADQSNDFDSVWEFISDQGYTISAPGIGRLDTRELGFLAAGQERSNVRSAIFSCTVDSNDGDNPVPAQPQFLKI